MRVVRNLALAATGLLAGAAGLAFYSHRTVMAEADRAWHDIASTATVPDQVFAPELVADLPRVARRYFLHAIAPGTPLRTTVELQMRGTFLLGDKSRHQAFAMSARQILAPPSAFVWLPSLRSGPVWISGSDALAQGKAWTRFWIYGLVPVADAKTSPDLVRSAAFRSAVEAIWAPAILLPQNGVGWEETGRDSARLTFGSGPEAVVLDMTLHENGAVRRISGLRWSNANPEKRFQLQPFGGTIEAEATFDGYTIPSVVHVGNFFGTSDYLPFFQAEITAARYL